MRVITYFALLLMTVLGLVAILQVQLVTDAITATGYSAGEVIGGIGSIVIIFYTVVFALTYRPG